eukprot:6178573-Pleurochrysis_carterae.AAC.1
MLQPHKLSPQSAACIYLGRAKNQPGHIMCLEPITKRIYVSPHARFMISGPFNGYAEHKHTTGSTVATSASTAASGDSRGRRL